MKNTTKVLICLLLTILLLGQGAYLAANLNFSYQTEDFAFRWMAPDAQKVFPAPGTNVADFLLDKCVLVDETEQEKIYYPKDLGEYIPALTDYALVSLDTDGRLAIRYPTLMGVDAYLLLSGDEILYRSGWDSETDTLYFEDVAAGKVTVNHNAKFGTSFTQLLPETVLVILFSLGVFLAMMILDDHYRDRGLWLEDCCAEDLARLVQKKNAAKVFWGSVLAVVAMMAAYVSWNRSNHISSMYEMRPELTMVTLALIVAIGGYCALRLSNEKQKKAK